MWGKTSGVEGGEEKRSDSGIEYKERWIIVPDTFVALAHSRETLGHPKCRLEVNQLLGSNLRALLRIL